MNILRLLLQTIALVLCTAGLLLAYAGGVLCRVAARVLGSEKA